ncbi:MAG TPA: hypothetical protein VJB99_04270 [Patescibacteria group bacterium]|nr:hypothetical protein [Patescibacteria group bacterium]
MKTGSLIGPQPPEHRWELVAFLPRKVDPSGQTDCGIFRDL